MSKRSEAHVALYQAGTLIPLRLTAWESLSHALTNGALWWEGETIYGASVLVRCATITDIHFVTADALAEQAADDVEDALS